ncbi:P-loop containing nucleoside triphosphate hydrolase protein [Tricharina praecox]|uniref:P-loop containing nucleoside triphosphate hydrolase protein n=1 Tax=Tricharina praecox TaxID=43433 RepID=UPI002220AE35|nr:P-loop containing nucleoside triphosphate hydrolase protein [Tricharina praecox]KAI5858375.1 P-loop containing nucleoside triphosphate hydrolase protein [Tricharina praecox]
MNGSSRLQAGGLRKTAAQGSMRAPARPGTSTRNYNSLMSSPARSTRSRAGTVSPRKASGESHDDHHGPPPRPVSGANINVVVRCRGRSEREKAENSAVIVSHPSTTEVALALGPLASIENKIYTFDRTFGPEADQQRIYDNVVQPLLNEVLDGYNCTIFAYGQTGTGKTYTMTGDMSDNYGSYADFAGIIPRALHKLFEKLGKDKDDTSVKCSFIELYNEELRDLLCVDESQKVKIYDAANGKGGVVVQGMEETYIMSAKQGVALLQEGSHKRQVAATKCNDLSSRSHTVFTITVNLKTIAEDGEVLIRTGKLNLVDLAGSENIGRSGAENKRAREAGMINQSLLTLGRVINALVDQATHIPYRESKLTRLLQDSLGGRTKTTIIATISPAKINLEETMSTLDYAARAKDIQNKPQVNQMLNKKTVIAEYVADIERLKSALHAARLKNGIFLPQEEFSRLNETVELQKAEVEEARRGEELLQNQITRLREQFEHNMGELLGTKASLEEQTRHMEETKEILRNTEITLSDTTTKLKEETTLRKAHQKTETELGAAAHDLLATARSTTSDIDGLRAKIGRMANVEVENHSSWMRSSSQVSQVTHALEDAVDLFKDEQANISSDISQRIASFVEAEKNTLQDAYNFVEQRFADFQATADAGLTTTHERQRDTDLILQEILTLRVDLKTRIGNGLRGLNDAAKRMAEDVIIDLGNFGAELHVSYEKFDAGFQAMVTEAQEHMAAQKSEIETLRSQLAEATATASAATTTAQSSLQTILVEEREKAAADRQNLISQITTLINNTGAAQDKRLTERVLTVKADIGATQTRLEAASKTHEETIESWSAREELFYTRLCDAKETVRSVLTDDWKNVESRNLAIKETTKSIHAQTIKLVEEQTEDVGVQLQDLDQAVANAHSMNDKYHGISMESINKIVDGGRQFVDKFSSLIDTLRNEMGSFEEASELAAQSIAAVESFSSNAQERLSQLRIKVESAPLKECLPTGHTPRKRKYTFPTILPSTGSAEDVLNRSRGGVVRTVLEEKEVNSPQKLTPSASSILTDPKSGGAGIGAAFYPTITNNKKKMFRDQSGAQGEPGGGVAESNIPTFKENGFSAATSSGDPKKSLIKKRKVGEAGADEGMSGMAAITTRRRMR